MNNPFRPHVAGLKGRDMSYRVEGEEDGFMNIEFTGNESEHDKLKADKDLEEL